MKIGIDCRHLNLKQKEGINSYTFGLIKGFKTIDKKISFIIFLNKGHKKYFNNKIVNNKFKIIEIGNSRGLFRKFLLVPAILLNSVILWKIINNLYYKFTGLNKSIENNCSILYTPTTVLNSYNLKIPTIVSMHDIQHVHFKNFFSKFELILRKLKFYNTINSVTYLQVSSNFIKKDLISNFPKIDKNKVKVIREGVDIDKFQISSNSLDLKKFNLPNNFIFYPAQTWLHKNHITIIKALKKLKDENIEIPLVMCGSKKSAHNSIMNKLKQYKLNNIIYLGIVSDNELINLYKSCKYLITAALYESSSLPILEAAATGTNIIASKTEPNIEISEKLRINLFEKQNYIDLANLIKCLYFPINKNLDLQNIKHNKIAISEFSWNNIAKKYEELFFKLLD